MRASALVNNLQIDPATERFAEMLTLPSNLLLTDQQRRAISDHIASLRCYLQQTPEADEKHAAQMLLIVTKMLLVLPGQKTTEVGAEAKAEAFMLALDDVPWWAVAAALRKWNRGHCGTDERGEPHDYRWHPAPATLRRIAQVEENAMLLRIRDLSRLLSAVEFVDCAAEIARGRKAMGGLFKVMRDKGDLAALTFERAIELGGKP